jgi:hypothetical protein
MNKLFELATKISTAWSLAAFAIAALIWFAVKMKKGKVPAVAWLIVVAIVIVALTPVVAPLYLNAYGIYRVRVVVLDERQMPTNDAKVTSSVGGEPKKVEGGWEFDIPAKTKPTDGKMQVYAAIPNDFLTGSQELELKDDYNPAIKIPLSKDTSAKIMGIVVDDANSPLEGARVGVVGFKNETLVTQQGGNFSLPAHKASGQQVQLSASKDGYSATTEWHQAGDFPATIVLRRQRTSKHKN